MGWGGKRGDVAVQGEEWVPERGWGAGRPPQGRSKTRGHLGCGWGRGTRCLRHCTPRGQPFPSSVIPPREQSWDGVPFPGDSGYAVPPVQPHGNGQPALEGAPRPPRQPPRGGDTEMCRGPPGQGPPWGIVTWGQGNGANQGLSPKQNCPSRPGAGGGGCSDRHPLTQHRTRVPWLRPHARVSPCRGAWGHVRAPPWAQAEFSGDKSQPRAARQGQPRRGHKDARTPITACTRTLEQSGCESPTLQAPQDPPSTLLQSPASLQNTPAPSEKNPGVTAPGQTRAALCPTAGYKHPPRVGKLRQRCEAGNLGALAPLKQLAFWHQAAASHATPM